MVSKKFWAKKTKDFLSLHEQVSEIREMQIKGISFDVFPGVFSPLISSDTKWFIEKLQPYYQRKTFLEIGTGTGIIACMAALNGARNVTATDISPVSVKNAICNRDKHGLNFPIYEGSVFEPISDKNLKFDVIFWNHPFNYTEEEEIEDDLISYSVFDPNYKYLEQFFSQSEKYLNDDGVLLLGTGNIARIKLIRHMARSCGYTICLVEKQEVPLHKDSSINMDVRLYSFKKNK